MKGFAIVVILDKSKYLTLQVINRGEASSFQNLKTYLRLDVLVAWLNLLKVKRVHACMEATGTYGEALAELYALGHLVSVVNPARIKGHVQSQMKRHKTDELDAEVIRHFCEMSSLSCGIR